ncbi:MAG: hypothetical protein QG556_960 [Pseudomonadota bacterium]|nr:hypothetical protein [Pseudomonadota bacterium]
MMIFRILSVLISSAILIGCSTNSAQYRFNQNIEPFCKKGKRYKHRETTPLKYYLDHNAYHWAKYRQGDRNYLVHQLSKYNMEYIRYRDIITVIIPVDQYFEFNSSRLDERQYQGLNNLVNLIYIYPCTTVHVAVFTDNVGTREENNHLSESQSEAMLTYLWANGIPADHLNAQGFGMRFPIADNNTTRGSAMNRRIEVQWTIRPDQSLKDVDLSQK